MNRELIVLLLAACAAACVAADAPAPGALAVNSLGMKMAWIPAGEFLMGSPADEKGREEEEVQRQVRITRPFRISTTEITQAQWVKVMGQRRGGFVGDELPVESISWNDAVAFCRKLSQLEGRTYRLPTEAEWEYACRAGSKGRFGGGEDLDELAWFDDNSGGQTHPAGGKKPNAWGIFDMHGNVAEWCSDRHGSYSRDDVTNPAGPAEGKARIVRGGSWGSFERGCRSASRGNMPVSYQLKTVGFRVVMEEAP